MFMVYLGGSFKLTASFSRKDVGALDEWGGLAGRQRILSTILDSQDWASSASLFSVDSLLDFTFSRFCVFKCSDSDRWGLVSPARRTFRRLQGKSSSGRETKPLLSLSENLNAQKFSWPARLGGVGVRGYLVRAKL